MFLFAGDYAKLKQLFPDVGAAYVIRHLVKSTIKKIEDEAAGATPDTPIKL